MCFARTDSSEQKRGVVGIGTTSLCTAPLWCERRVTSFVSVVRAPAPVIVDVDEQEAVIEVVVGVVVLRVCTTHEIRFQACAITRIVQALYLFSTTMERFIDVKISK